MNGEEVKALRHKLSCTARELGEAIGASQQEVMAWEREELFPTKRFIVLMRRLDQGGRATLATLTQAAAAKKAGLPVSAAQRGAPPPTAGSARVGAPGAAPLRLVKDDGDNPSSRPWAALADPALWCLVRKLAAHPALRREVEALAERYADPADESPPSA